MAGSRRSKQAENGQKQPMIELLLTFRLNCLLESRGDSKIQRSIAAKLIWLENEITRGERVIMARWEAYLDSDEANEQHTALIGYFGWEALRISGMLIDEYSLGYARPDWGMGDVKNLLADQHASAMVYLRRDS